MPRSVSAARFPYVLHSLSDAQDYEVYVTVVSAGGESTASQTLTASTNAFRIQAVVNPDGDGITVQTSTQGGVNAAGDYTIYWQSGSLVEGSTRVSTLPHTLTGLKRGLEYGVYIEVSGNNGVSRTSNLEFVGLPLPSPTLEKLTALGFGGMEVRAEPPPGIEDIPRVDYRVYWREDGGESMPESVSADRFPHVLHSLSDATNPIRNSPAGCWSRRSKSQKQCFHRRH